MADTGSDRAGSAQECVAGRSARRWPHPTLRLRLTLLYGMVFVLAGAGLLAVTYGLFKHNQASSGREVALGGVQFQLPPDARVTVFGSQPSTIFTRTVPTGHPGAVRRPPQTQLLRQLQSSGQKQLASQVHNVVRRANVELRAQQAGDASSLLEWSAIALGIVALLSIAAAWWLSGRALSPLRTMNARAREISAESLHQRLGVDHRHDELGELAATFDSAVSLGTCPQGQSKPLRSCLQVS